MENVEVTDEVMIDIFKKCKDVAPLLHWIIFHDGNVPEGEIIIAGGDYLESVYYFEIKRKDCMYITSTKRFDRSRPGQYDWIRTMVCDSIEKHLDWIGKFLSEERNEKK